MNLTPKQFKKQNAVWQDNYYTYAIHKTDGGAIYLYRIDGKRITQNKLNNMEIFRLDGMNLNLFIKNYNKANGEYY